MYAALKPVDSNAFSVRPFTRAHIELPFPLLVDPEHRIAETYGTWQERQRPDGEKFMGIARSHFVIDEQGNVVDVQYNVSPEDSVSRYMETLSS